MNSRKKIVITAVGCGVMVLCAAIMGGVAIYKRRKEDD